jgi:hypothetical protein
LVASVFKNAFTTASVKAPFSRVIVSDELERMWKEAGVFYLDVGYYARSYLEGLRKATKMSGHEVFGARFEPGSSRKEIY